MSGFFSLFALSLALAADAFTIAVCKGLSLGRRKLSDAAVVGGWFGFFQALMPLVGFLSGRLVRDAIAAVDHWISFFLLSSIGIRMLLESWEKNEDAASIGQSASLGIRAMLPSAFACSIDALAVGVIFSFSPLSSLPLALVTIGATTFLLSAIGVYIASIVGSAYRRKAEGFGGILLIFLGIKILCDHLFHLPAFF